MESNQNACFIQSTIDKQVEVAEKVREIDNRDRILFDSHFVTSNYKLYGNFRVEVDRSGREAILSSGAQKCFSIDYYYSFVFDKPSVARVKDVILYLKK